MREAKGTGSVQAHLIPSELISRKVKRTSEWWEAQVVEHKADTRGAASALTGSSWDVSMAALSSQISPVAHGVAQATD